MAQNGNHTGSAGVGMKLSFAIAKDTRTPKPAVRVQLEADKKDVGQAVETLSAADLLRPSDGKGPDIVIPLIKRNWTAGTGSASRSKVPSSLQEVMKESKARSDAIKSGGALDSMFESEVHHEQGSNDADDQDGEDVRMTDAKPLSETAKSMLLNGGRSKHGAQSTGQPSAIEVEAMAILLKRAEEHDAAKDDEEMVDAPLLVANAIPGLADIRDEKERLRRDVEMRPEDTTLDAYERVPVESFGKGMLLGMGWTPGGAVGNTNARVVKPIEFVARPSLMGLGAAHAKPRDKKNKKRILKPGESAEGKEYMRVAPDADGKKRSYRTLDERLIKVHSMQLREGCLVEFRSGKHKRLYGRVEAMKDSSKKDSPDQQLTVRLNLNGESVTVTRADVDILDENALPSDHPALLTGAAAAEMNSRSLKRKEPAPSGASNGDHHHHHHHHHDKGDHSSKSSRRSHDDHPRHESDSHGHKRSRSRSSGGGHHHDHDRRDDSRKRSPHRDHVSSSKRRRSRSRSRSKERARISWVVPGLRLRIVNQGFQKGRYYTKKGRVVDVVDQFSFTMQMEEGQLVEGVTEADVETVLPSRGGRVMILHGPHKRSSGHMMEKSKEKEIALVQTDGDLEVVHVSFDQIAEYVGSRTC